MAMGVADWSTWDSIGASLAQWNSWTHVWDIAWTRRQGRVAIDAAAGSRLEALVKHARTHSRLYEDLYRPLPERGIALDDLPPTRKPDMMARFDDWVTDPLVSRAGVEEFLHSSAKASDRFLGQYAVWKSSGSSGEPGLFLQDAESLATFDALVSSQLGAGAIARSYASGLMANGGRAALVTATGAHFAAIASWERIRNGNPWLEGRAFSVMLPVAQLVAELNAYQPAFLSSYPTVIGVLAEEQAAGRLRLRPAGLWCGGERLSAALQADIERSFGCPVVNEYGSSECLSIAFGCRHGWLHVNADWVMLEAVDEHYHPVAPGQTSSTTLLTNLSNYVQPIIRYDLGDRITMATQPCPCGSPLPALHVEGRIDDVLVLRQPSGLHCPIVPMAITTVIEEATGLHRFQIEQTGPQTLVLRLDTHGLAHPARTIKVAHKALRDFLGEQGLNNVEIRQDDSPPHVDARSGKFRQILYRPA